MDSESTKRWIRKLADGDEDAATRLVDRYSDKLVQLARRKLVSMPPQVADDEGAVISALRSFFSGVKAEQFPTLDNHDDLWKVLATLTIRKAIAQLRRHWKQSGEGGRIDGTSEMASFVDDGPGPDQVAMIIDECQTRLDQLEDDVLRKIALLRLEGCDTKEIAEQLDVHTRTVQRKLLLISNAWMAVEARPDRPGDE